MLRLLSGLILPYMTTGKTIALSIRPFWQSDVSALDAITTFMVVVLLLNRV